MKDIKSERTEREKCISSDLPIPSRPEPDPSSLPLILLSLLASICPFFFVSPSYSTFSSPRHTLFLPNFSLSFVDPASSHESILRFRP